MEWTKEQQDAIYKKDSNILVAAAAGSGKTAVLVERIIQKILKDNVDIDKLLVVTFTNAAAAEMRERVLDAIYKKLEEGENENLQRQLILLGKSNICTIHSFCLDVIRNNFFEIDLPSNFRIAAEEEVSLLKQEVLEDLFEKLYEEENEDFAKLIDTYTSYRGDEQLKEIVLKIYNFIQSFPFPNEWLEQSIAKFENQENIDFSETDFGKILLNDIEEEIIDAINSLKVYRNKIEKYSELEKYTNILNLDIENLKAFQKAVKTSWDKANEFYNTVTIFTRWPTDKKITFQIKDEAKTARDDIRDNFIKKRCKDIFIYDSKEAFSDLFAMHDILEKLKKVIFAFSENYSAKKRERNIIDFNDIEHFALKILVKKDENGEYIPTEVAKKYQEKFEEIAIDEYQDSNQVQEYILSKISRGNNMFMVGDVKQSIYKFRGACPELFLKKYNTYDIAGNDDGLKIKLFKNFRSAENVLDFTNKVFESIMSENLGDINYTEEEFLNLGAEYEEKENGVGKAELHIIELEDDGEDEDIYKTEDGDSENEENDIRNLEKQEIEAKFVANKIEELIANKLVIKDKKVGYREITYKDIVILLRSTSNIAPIFEKELLNRNIPVYTDATSEYLDTIEIQTIMNVLKILDNPINDIALVSVLRSQIGGFTDNELVEIRLVNKDANFYTALCESKEKASENLKLKIANFLTKIEEWRNKSEYLNLAELIWKIYNDTGFYNYVSLMPNGSLRQANLKMLFERAKEYEKTSFKGLFNFIRFIEKIKMGSDLSAAKVIGENENVVRIMSIHKSKGLEFPVVFLANSSKKVNLQDLRERILLNEKLGLGPEYRNYDKMIRYSTSAKKAIAIAGMKESISEEMRILYVALTRAKEKLIISGTVKDYAKKTEQKKSLLEVYNTKENSINPILLKKFTSYLDWLELVTYSKNMEDTISTFVHNQAELLKEKKQEEKEIPKFNFEKDVDIEKIKKKLNFEYKYDFATKLQTKSTVSKIKQMQVQDIVQEVGLASIEPKFMQETEKVSSAEKGTLMHLMLQKLNFQYEYNLEKLENLKQELIAKKFITELQANNINLNKIEKFLNSDFANQIKNAKQIEKEKAFCTKILAKEVYEEAGEGDEILVQGIIDLYFVNQEDELILLDYKTDFVENGKENELIVKYKKQLEIYRKALEEALKRKVDKTYIYSLYLNKEILI